MIKKIIFKTRHAEVVFEPKKHGAHFVSVAEVWESDNKPVILSKEIVNEEPTAEETKPIIKSKKTK